MHRNKLFALLGAKLANNLASKLLSSLGSVLGPKLGRNLVWFLGSILAQNHRRNLPRGQSLVHPQGELWLLRLVIQYLVVTRVLTWNTGRMIRVLIKRIFSLVIVSSALCAHYS